jgi:Family of unknown function (DUF6787)
MFEGLKKRWKVKDNWQFAVIFTVFAITGSSAAKITGPLLKFFTIFEEMNPWAFNGVYVVATLIFYQFLLVFFGWLFGEFDFFYKFVMKILKSLGLKFLTKK